MEFYTAKQIIRRELIEIKQDIYSERSLRTKRAPRHGDTCINDNATHHNSDIEKRIHRLVSRQFRLESTLIKIKNNEFALCQSCEDIIESVQLRFDITSNQCISCKNSMKTNSHLSSDSMIGNVEIAR